MAKDSGKDGHDDKSAEGGREDDKAGMAHSHESRDKEGFVANFGDENHRKGENKGMHRADDFVFVFDIGIFGTIAVRSGG